MVHTVRDVPYTYKGHHTVISKVKGWHCLNCGEVEFKAGEGVRFAEAIKQVAKEIDAKEAAELLRIRKKLKLTQQEAALDYKFLDCIFLACSSSNWSLCLFASSMLRNLKIPFG